MRFMVMVRATPDSEAARMPDEKLLAEMGRFNEEMVKAGVMLSGEGLQPSAKGARVRFDGDTRTVIEGPLPVQELIAGFWILDVASRQDAIDWIKRSPNPFPGRVSEIEIRQIFEAEDFGDEFTPELREQEERMRREMEKKAGKG
ncbi:MAG TPA: YciI family protein [bacterium]|nr:YciI family protein [bacterium]